VAIGSTVQSCVERGGLVRISELGPDRRLELLGGKMGAELEPQAPGTSFGITTREGSAVAVGTGFSVEVLPGDGPGVTRVLHGAVVVRPVGAPERRVGPHEMIAMRESATRPLPAADEEHDRALVSGARPPSHDGDAEPIPAQFDSDAPSAIVTVDER